MADNSYTPTSPSLSGNAQTPSRDRPSASVLPGRALRVGVLTNPLSGGNRQGGRAVQRVIAARQPMSCHDVRTPADVATALGDCARQEVDVVAVNGGDGTIQAVLTTLLHDRPFQTLPLLAILTAGTSSMVARDVGVGGSPARALSRLLAWASARDHEGTVSQRHVLRMETPTVEGVRYGMSFGAGLIHDGIRFCRDKIERYGFRGQVGPMLTTVLFLLTLGRGSKDGRGATPMTIGLNGEPGESLQLSAVLVTTLEQLFLGLRPYWGDESAPLHCTTVLARPRHWLRVLPALLRGRTHPYGIPQHGYISHNVREVQVVMDGGFTLDGELFEADRRLGPIVLQDAGPVSFLRW